jgi:hypothetical protein
MAKFNFKKHFKSGKRETPKKSEKNYKSEDKKSKMSKDRYE